MSNIEPPNEYRLGTRKDVARMCSVSERTVFNWQRDKLIPYLAIGPRTIRFDLDQVEAALARNHRIAARGEAA